MERLRTSGGEFRIKVCSDFVAWNELDLAVLDVVMAGVWRI